MRQNPEIGNKNTGERKRTTEKIVFKLSKAIAEIDVVESKG